MILIFFNTLLLHFRCGPHGKNISARFLQAVLTSHHDVDWDFSTLWFFFLYRCVRVLEWARLCVKCAPHRAVMVQVSEKLNHYSRVTKNKPIVWFDWSSFLCLFWYWVVPESLETSKQRSIFFYTVPLLHCNCVD